MDGHKFFPFAEYLATFFSSLVLVLCVTINFTYCLAEGRM